MAAIAFADYLLLERIGLGGTAEIFRAVRRGRHPGEPDVALKRLLPPLAEDPVIARLFLREVGALDRIRHPRVVPLLAHGEHAGLPYLVMPLYDGTTLRELLPGFDVPVAWYAFFGPPSLPGAIVSRWNSEIVKTIESPDVRQKLTESSMALMYTPPEQMAGLIKGTAEVYERLFKSTGITLED